jgi:hypothetical protein
VSDAAARILLARVCADGRSCPVATFVCVASISWSKMTGASLKVTGK